MQNHMNLKNMELEQHVCLYPDTQQTGAIFLWFHIFPSVWDGYTEPYPLRCSSFIKGLHRRARWIQSEFVPCFFKKKNKHFSKNSVGFFVFFFKVFTLIFYHPKSPGVSVLQLLCQSVQSVSIGIFTVVQILVPILSCWHYFTSSLGVLRS